MLNLCRRKKKEVRVMKVKVIKRYNDLVLKKIQKVDTIFEVTDERGKYLIGQGMVEEFKEDTKSQEAEAAKEPKGAKNTGKD